MKKLSYYIVISVLSLLFLVGCSGASDNNAQITPSAAVSPTPEISSGPDVNSATPTPSPSPSPSPSPTPTPTPIPTIKDMLTETDDPGVYRLSTMDIKGYYMNAFKMGGKLIYFYNVDSSSDPCIISYDIATGEKKETSFNISDTSDYTFKIINDDTIMIGLGDAQFVLLDSSLNEINRITVPTPAGKYYPEYTYNHDFSKIYYHDASVVYELDTRTGESKQVLKNSRFKDSYLSSLSTDDSHLWFYLYDEAYDYDTTHYVDLETGEIERVYPVANKLSVIGVSPDRDIAVVKEWNSSGVDIYTIKDDPAGFLEFVDKGLEIPGEFEKKTLVFRSSKEFYSGNIDWERGLLITVRETTRGEVRNFEFTAYSLDTCEPVSNYLFSIELPYYPQYRASLDIEDGYLFVSGTVYDEPYCCVWDYANDTFEDFGNRYIRYNYIPSYLDEKRKEIEKKYNIYVYLGTEILGSRQDYYLSFSDDPYKMYQTLCMFDEVVSGCYPAGILEQIKYEDIKTLGLYLCAGFNKKESYGIDTAVALAGEDSYERFMSLDITCWGDLRKNIIHEFSHWIDSRINKISDKTDEFDFEKDWMDMNPEDFYYMDDYNKASPFGRYTCSAAKEDAYFIDTYSLTKATEDRARMFENLMRYSQGDGIEYFESDAIRAKMHLYFDYIRKCFDTTGWPEETEWERKLRLLDEMYSGNEDITFETIYPEAFSEEEDYSLDVDPGYISAYVDTSIGVG